MNRLEGVGAPHWWFCCCRLCVTCVWSDFCSIYLLMPLVSSEEARLLGLYFWVAQGWACLFLHTVNWLPLCPIAFGPLSGVAKLLFVLKGMYRYISCCYSADQLLGVRAHTPQSHMTCVGQSSP